MTRYPALQRPTIGQVLSHLFSRLNEKPLEEVAEITGLHQATIRSIRQGNVKKPRPQTVKALADYFGYQTADLYDLSSILELRFLKPRANAPAYRETKSDRGDTPPPIKA